MSLNQYIEKTIEDDLIEIDEDNRITYKLQNFVRDFENPEEPVRATAYGRLIYEFGYPPEKIDFEVRVPVRPERYIDIAVFKDDEQQDVFLAVECKAGANKDELETARNDGLGECNSLDSPYLYIRGGEIEEAYDVQSAPSTASALKEYRIPAIPEAYGEPNQYTYIKEEGSDLESAGFDSLKRAFETCHDIIWAGGKRDPAMAFDEMSKLVFAKIYDERNTKNGEAYLFQVGREESQETVASKVFRVYEEAQRIDPSVFTEEIKISVGRIEKVVKKLQGISLIDSSLDVKGRAFETFLGTTFRGELGQYFTRRELVEFMLEIIDVNDNDIVLDPACGSGGFLLYVLREVREKIEKNYKGDESTIARKKYDFAQNQLYGIEINKKIARVAMMDMVLHDDAHTNITYGTGLENQYEDESIEHGKFSVVLTNPPFGDTVESDDTDKLGSNDLENFRLAKKQSGDPRTKERSGLLFLENCYNFLEKGGKLGIVLSDGILSNRSYQYRQAQSFIQDRFKLIAIISLPQFAFNYTESGLRTSLVFLEKDDNSEEGDTSHEVLMALPEKIGYDSTGRSDDNELPAIARVWNQEEEPPNDRVFWKPADEIDERLDPLFYYLSPIIEDQLDAIPYQAKSLDDACDGQITTGSCPKGGCRRSSGEIPVLKIGNMTNKGGINLTGTEVRNRLDYVPRSFYEDHKESAALESRDILIAKDGATTGLISLVPNEFELDDSMINEHIFRVRVTSEDFTSEYVFAFLFSELGQLQIEREISGSAQGGITKSFVENIKIPVPPISRQEELASKLLEEIEKSKDLLGRSAGKLVEATSEFGEQLAE